MERSISRGRGAGGTASGGAVGPVARPDLGSIYETHGAGIRAHCGRLLGDSASAEDASQEVFLRVRRYAGHLPGPAELRPWLFRIATNHCLNELRSRNVRARTAPQLNGGVTTNMEDALAARGDARRFLERLPPRARAIAWLTFVDGMLQHEVAETLGVSRRTVVNYLNQVRARVHSRSTGPAVMAR